jgi:Development and cell death domain
MYDGYIFFCNKTSQQQCLSNKRYTCADGKIKPSEEQIKIGSIVFLYNIDDKSLLGPFTALPEGDELDAGAWAMDVDVHIPSEDLKVTWEDLHLIQNAPEKLPFLNDPKTCKLTSLQTQRTLDVLKQGELYLNTKDR